MVLRSQGELLRRLGRRGTCEEVKKLMLRDLRKSMLLKRGGKIGRKDLKDSLVLPKSRFFLKLANNLGKYCRVKSCNKDNFEVSED